MKGVGLYVVATGVEGGGALDNIGVASSADSYGLFMIAYLCFLSIVLSFFDSFIYVFCLFFFQMGVRLVPNQSVQGKYNMISV